MQVLRSSQHMHIIPHLRQHRKPVILRALSGFRLIEPRARATEVRRSARLPPQRVLDVLERVAGRVRGPDPRPRQPVIGRVATEVGYDRGEVVEDVFVLDPLGAVAGKVEGREAGGVLGEFVGPEVVVGGIEVDPVSACVN